MKLQDFGSAAFLLGPIFGLLGGLAFIANHLGFLWAVVAFFLAPATIAIAPIYKWVAMGDSSLFMWSYGLVGFGVAVMWVFGDKK